MARLMVRVLMMVSVLTAAATASAQDPAFGVTFGFPGSIGVIWHPATRVALRPTVTFAHGGDDASTGSDAKTSVLSASLSGLFYLRSAGPLRVFVSPRYVHTRGTTRTSMTVQVPTVRPSGVIFATSTVVSESRRREHGGAGLIGAEYRLGERFAISGEAGIQYSRFSSRTSYSLSSVVIAPSERWNVGSVGGVAVTVYF